MKPEDIAALKSLKRKYRANENIVVAIKTVLANPQEPELTLRWLHRELENANVTRGQQE